MSTPESKGASSPGAVLVGDLQETLDRYVEMAAMLRSLEWFNDTGHGSTCPRCLAGISRGHAPDCPLDALLGRIGR